MMMSDRLTTPLLLSFEDLAVLSVLLALAGPPFRLLELAVAYTLMPELKSAADGRAASRGDPTQLVGRRKYCPPAHRWFYCWCSVH
jgi:hypothetical protein